MASFDSIWEGFSKKFDGKGDIRFSQANLEKLCRQFYEQGKNEEREKHPDQNHPMSVFDKLIGGKRKRP